MTIDEKEINKSLQNINIILAKQAVVLEDHTRRSTTLEKYVHILEKKTAEHSTFIKLSMGVLPITVAVTSIVVQIFMRVM